MLLSENSAMPFNNEIDLLAGTPVTVSIPAPDESIRDHRRRLHFFEAGQLMLMTRNFRPLTRFRAAGRLIIHEVRQLCIFLIYYIKLGEDDIHQIRLRRLHRMSIPQQSLDLGDLPRFRRKSVSATIATGPIADDSWRHLPSREEGVLAIARWIVRTPLMVTLHYTVPDCRQAEWRRWFLLTFAMAIFWTAVFSYVMVWMVRRPLSLLSALMVTLLGFTLGIPDSIMGITFLAAGTSVPDAFASLIVARQGQGDMAVSNSIGSNVFDILIGLALPWFIQTTMVNPGSLATINSRGMVYSVVLLFLTIIITISGVYLSGWQLTNRLGIVLLVLYLVFLTASCMIEFNVFGFVNPPMLNTERDISFKTRKRIVEALVFLMVSCGCESWTLRKKEERKRIEAFEIWT
ncbi:SLC24A4 [Cordylochernes scorpioides]|uniref:SLC24A4 n=1 Tax=Cordylochernes scorpioides TaxID=51811 RepID=A0ABY6L0M6_9ARAC|nr:SLC24A4 [Cordylochernes scorpioides]